MESSFTSPSATAPFGLAGSEGRHQNKALIENYLNKSSYMGRDPLTNQAISAANAAQAAAAAVAAAAANAANVTTSSANLASASNLFQSSSANPLLNNPLASSTAFGMTGLPGTNTLLEDLIEGKHISKHLCMSSCINPLKSTAKTFIQFYYIFILFEPLIHVNMNLVYCYQ